MQSKMKSFLRMISCLFESYNYGYKGLPIRTPKPASYPPTSGKLFQRELSPTYGKRPESHMPDNQYCDPVGLNAPLQTQAGLLTDDASILEAAKRVCEATFAPNASESDRMSAPNPPEFSGSFGSGVAGIDTAESLGRIALRG